MDAYSEENIMEKIMSLDGEGSGLDADLLDGKHGSEYASAAQGIRADSAIQGVKGSNILIVPDSDDYVNITPENIKATCKFQPTEQEIRTYHTLQFRFDTSKSTTPTLSQ